MEDSPCFEGLKKPMRGKWNDWPQYSNLPRGVFEVQQTSVVMWALEEQEWHSLLLSVLTPDLLRSLVSLPFTSQLCDGAKATTSEKEALWLRGASQSWRKADRSKANLMYFYPLIQQIFLAILGSAWNCSRNSERHRDPWGIASSHSFITVNVERGWLCPKAIVSPLCLSF